jgi:secreted PhoX family phosphatase
MFSRRVLLRSGLAGAGALTLGPAFWRNAFAAAPVRAAEGPYGPLQPPDANGIMLPKGFSSREIARAGQPVPGTAYPFPIFPDGSATFATPDGGWILAINTEVPEIGGASAIRFAADGTVTDAYRILENTSTNCAGGPTPWGTWLSCEEVDTGLVWECDPTGATPAVARRAMGAFKHEAACVDPERQRLYLSEDVGGGGLYRFTPKAYPDLSSGLLEIACDGGSGKVVWKRVPDPSGATAPTRDQVPGKLPFARGEGIWFDAGIVYLATTSDETIHAYDTAAERIEILYRADDVPGTPLRGVDNLHVSRSGDLFVAEDSYTNDPDAMDVCLLTPEREVSRFLKLTGDEHRMPGEAESETVGLCFDPSGERFYFGSQRGAGLGIVYEVTGPFRKARPTTPTPGVPLGLDVAKRLRLRRFLRRSLPVALTLDAPATVRLRLTVRDGDRRVVVARAKRELARGMHLVKLRPTKAGRRRLSDGGSVRARLVVSVETDGAPKRVLRRRVRLVRRRG